MNVSIEFSPTGIEYIDIKESVDWYNFHKFAKFLFANLGVENYRFLTDDAVVDSRWSEFVFNDNTFNLIFEEWPPECVIESKNPELLFAMSSILKTIPYKQ